MKDIMKVDVKIPRKTLFIFFLRGYASIVLPKKELAELAINAYQEMKSRPEWLDKIMAQSLQRIMEKKVEDNEG